MVRIVQRCDVRQRTPCTQYPGHRGFLLLWWVLALIRSAAKDPDNVTRSYGLAPLPAPLLARLRDKRRISGRCGLSALFVVATMTTAGAETIFTRTDGTSCQTVNRIDEVSERRCRGPAGYVAVITNSGGVLRIDYRSAMQTPAPTEPLGSNLRWRGSGPLIGDRIEWQLQRGRPISAITRIFSASSADRPEQQILVAGITSLGSCEISRLNAADADAYNTARDLAGSQASISECKLAP